MEATPVKLTPEREATAADGRKLWVQASPCSWPQLFELLAAEGLCMTCNWRVLQEQHASQRSFCQPSSFACQPRNCVLKKWMQAKEKLDLLVYMSRLTCYNVNNKGKQSLES